VVLDEAAPVEVGGDVHQPADADERRVEVRYRKTPDVVLAGELEAVADYFERAGQGGAGTGS
jgi:hypothetical protein